MLCLSIRAPGAAIVQGSAGRAAHCPRRAVARPACVPPALPPVRSRAMQVI